MTLPFFLAPSDYTNESGTVIFLPDELTSRMLCANITIILDSVVENTESFLVVLNSSDPSVVLTQSTVTINISDSSGKYFLLIIGKKCIT